MREIAVGQHRAFRTSCGTRRVDDGEHVIRLDPGDGPIEHVVIDAFSEVHDRVESAGLEVENVTQPLIIIANLLKGLRVRGVPCESDDRLDLLDDGGRLLGRIRLIYRNAYRADRGAGKIHHAPFITSRGINDHHATRFDIKTDKTFRHGANTSEHLGRRHIMPLPSIVILPLRNKIIRGLLRTARQQCVDRILVRGAVSRFRHKFSQHGFYSSCRPSKAHRKPLKSAVNSQFQGFCLNNPPEKDVSRNQPPYTSIRTP